jgi:hypothetical protein
MKAKPAFARGAADAKVVRILAVLLTFLLLGLALFSKAFRYGRDCQRTLGQSSPRGEVYGLVMGSRQGVAVGTWANRRERSRRSSTLEQS